MKTDPIVAFDFDGTIVSRVTAYVFYKWLIQQSLIRILLFFTALPVILTLISMPATRTTGFTLISYIATAFQSRNLFRIRADFIDYYFNHSNVVVFSRAIEQIKLHNSRHEKIIILSGCPQWLLSGIIKRLGIKNAKLIGSKLHQRMTGLCFTKHCFASNKVLMAKEHGINLESLTYGYSDSIADLPWLKYCKQVTAINQSLRNLSKFNQLVDAKVSHQKW